MVIKIRISGQRKFNTEMIEAQLRALSPHTPFVIYKTTRHGGHVTKVWVKRKPSRRRWTGHLRIRNGGAANMVLVNAAGADEQRFTGSWIEWIIQYFANKGVSFEIDARKVLFIR